MSGIIIRILPYIFIKSAYTSNISVPYIRADTGTVGNTIIRDLKVNRDSMTHKGVYTHVCTLRP
jgi:hypothetical protein